MRRIEWQRTAGELGALLREAALVKELEPVYNRQLRRPGQLCGFAVRREAAAPRARRGDRRRDAAVRVRGVALAPRAMQALRDAADEHRLCLQTLGFDVKKQGACLRHQIGRCAGVCAGKESIHVHHARVAAALAGLKERGLAARGPLGVVERDRRPRRDRGARARPLVLPRHRELRQPRSPICSKRAAPRFDYDHYRILARHLGKRGVRVVPLAA